MEFANSDEFGEITGPGLMFFRLYWKFVISMEFVIFVNVCEIIGPALCVSDFSEIWWNFVILWMSMEFANFVNSGGIIGPTR